MDGTIRFRGIDSYEDKERFQGEPNLLAKDLWFNGYGHVQTIPGISATYWIENMKRVRGLRGTSSNY